MIIEITNVESSLMLCPFSKIIVVDSTLRPVLRTPRFLAYLQPEFLPVAHALYPVKKWLAISLTFMSLLSPWADLVTLIIIVVYRAHRWIKKTVVDFVPHSNLHSSSGSMKTSQQGGSFPVGTNWFLLVLWPQCNTVYRQVWWAAKSNGNRLY